MTPAAVAFFVGPARFVGPYGFGYRTIATGIIGTGACRTDEADTTPPLVLVLGEPVSSRLDIMVVIGAGHGSRSGKPCRSLTLLNFDTIAEGMSTP